jgi:WD40 repeat protein
MAVSPDEKMVVSGSADGRLWLWNLKKGTMVDEPWEGHDGQVRCLDWSPNGLEITSGLNNGIIRRWNPDTGRQIASPIETGHGWVNAVEYSPQGDTFTSCGNDMMIGVWSKDGQLLFKIKGHENIVMSLCWSKDSARIFSASCDGTIRQWRLIDGENSSFFGVMPKPSHPFVCPLMKDILSVHQMTALFAAGISRPISKLEVHSCMTMNSWLLSCPPMEITLPVLD